MSSSVAGVSRDSCSEVTSARVRALVGVERSSKAAPAEVVEQGVEAGGVERARGGAVTRDRGEVRRVVRDQARELVGEAVVGPRVLV